jgi:hypothetical protein
MKAQLKGIIIAALAIGNMLVAQADAVWPADGAWTALTIGPSLYNDISSEINPASVDLVGTADSYSAGYWALVENGDILGGVTNDAFMFRMRLRGNGDGKKFVWQTHLDTNGDSSNVEWIFQLVNSGSGNGVELIQTAVGGPTLGDISTVSNNSWLGTLELYSRWIAISGSTDFHVDFSIPWNEFSAITSVTDIRQMRAVLSTSAAHNQTNKDAPLGRALGDQISNMLSETIPEPAVVTLLLGTGGGMLAFRRIFKGFPEDNDGNQT